jgi:hypothetical protein
LQCDTSSGIAAQTAWGRAQILPTSEVFDLSEARDLVDAEFVIERGRKVKAAMTP